MEGFLEVALKTPTGAGKDVFRDLIKKKKKQSPNFIFDISKSPLPQDEIERQMQGIFASQFTQFVDKIVVVKDNKILKVYQRQ